MSKLAIRSMMTSELKHIFKLIQRDFTHGEYAPYEILYEQIQNGIQEGLVFCDGLKDLAYSICAVNKANGFVLISLFAVFEEYRGKGIGSSFMDALKTLYEKKQGIIVEVEKPECARNEEELDFRKRRIEFYQKLGFRLIERIDYTIWDVPMHLMILPLQTYREISGAEIGEIMHQIYFRMMGERFMHKLEFKVLD